MNLADAEVDGVVEKLLRSFGLEPERLRGKMGMEPRFQTRRFGRPTKRCTPTGRTQAFNLAPPQSGTGPVPPPGGTGPGRTRSTKWCASLLKESGVGDRENAVRPVGAL